MPPLPTDSAASLRLGEVIGALSYALDLTEGQPPGHCLRACWVAMHVGREIGMSDDDLSDLYYVVLLKDAGCSSNAARMCELFQGDDRVAKRNVKTVNLQNVLQHGKYVLSNAGPNARFWQRMKILSNLVRNGEALAQELITARCDRGAEIALQLGFTESVANGVRCLDEHWNGKGRPQHLAGTAIPRSSQLALLAQVVDVFRAADGSKAARDVVRKRSGVWFDPDLCDAFERVANNADFWRAFDKGDFEARVQALEPNAAAIPVTEARLDAIAEGFGRVIDAKSPFTAGHSSRVGDFCEAMAHELDLDPMQTRWLRRAGLLHDVGKLGVSNTVLDKPGKLDADEWEAIRKHPVYTHEILSRIGPFRDLAVVAGAHHERLDGCGYPWGMKDSEIALETRIIAIADIYDAVTADRPYRAAMSSEKGLAILEAKRDIAVDGRCLDALKKVLRKQAEGMQIAQAKNVVVERVTR